MADERHSSNYDSAESPYSTALCKTPRYKPTPFPTMPCSSDESRTQVFTVARKIENKEKLVSTNNA